MDQTRLTVMEAIARRRTIEASYNATRIVLAPHLLFERHGDLFVSAVNLSKQRRHDDEQRLGQFKLAGLMEAVILDDGFKQLSTFQPVAPRLDDRVLLTV
jgi:hypothetical protein